VTHPSGGVSVPAVTVPDSPTVKLGAISDDAPEMFHVTGRDAVVRLGVVPDVQSIFFERWRIF